MANRFTDLKKENRFENLVLPEEIPWGVEEPTGIAEPLPKKEPWVKPETITKPISTVFRKSFGAVSWPFERASILVGTPAKAIAEEHRRTLRRFKTGEKIGLVEQATGLAKALGRTAPSIAKSFVSKEIHPKTTNIFEFMTQDILKDFSDEQNKLILGLAAEFAISPAIVGKALKTVIKGTKLTGIPAKISARRIPEWQRMKTRARMKTQVRIERAGEAVKPLRRRDVKKLAQELSKRTGKKISPSAVKQRLTQIVKGSVVAEPGRAPMTPQQIARIGRKGISPGQLAITAKAPSTLQKLANPAIQEFTRTSKELTKLGIMPKETYLDKLSKKRITELLAQKTQLQSRLAGVYRAPYKHTILTAAEKLKVSGQPKLAEKLIDLAIRVEKKNPELGNQLSRLFNEGVLTPQKLLEKLSQIESAGLAERTRLIKSLELLSAKNRTIADKILGVAIRIEKKNPQLGQRLSKVLELKTVQPQTMLNYLTKIENAGLRERASLISGLERLATKAESASIQASKIISRITQKRPELSERLSKIVDIRGGADQKMLNLLSQIEKAGLKERTSIINNLEKLAVSAEKQRVIGKVPLIKKVSKMQRRFPGQTKLAKDIQGQISEIDMRILQSYHPGADIIRLPDGTPYISGGATRYFPRIYESKELERAARNFPVYGKEKIRAPYAKQRQRIPEEVRKAMGEITKEPAYPIAKRLIQQGADIETAKLFQQVASRPGLASKIWYKGMSKKALPDDKAYGALRGMFVKPRIYDEVTELFRTKGKVEQLYDTAIGTWKTFKVTYSPSTQFRNKFSNKVLLDMSGMGYGEQAKYAGRVFKEWKGNTREYQVAKRYFARTTMIKGELFDDVLRTTMQAKGTGFEKALNSIRRGVKKGAEVPSAVYQHNEIAAKMMKYFQQRDLGKSVIEAVEEANKWLFDYSDLTKWEKLIARRVMPFYTFPRKALPRVAEALAERPHVVAKYPLMAKMMTQYSLYKLEMTDDDYEKLTKTLPEYMKGGSYILMPYRDINGDLRFFDWTYIVPWGEIAEIQGRGVLQSVVTNPLVQLVGDIQRNKSSFTEREIWKETDTFEEKTWKQTEYIWRNLVPSLAYKGIYWDKIAEAATEKPSKYGKVRPVPETIAHTIFGMRTQPIDEKRQAMFNYYEQQEKRMELTKKLSDIGQRRKARNITESEYIRLKNQYKKQLKDLSEK